jgi:rhodanese-related sulfurtransferase
MTLPDEVQVFPGHGAGSLCGKHISSETSSTIGEQRRHNYALQPRPRARFIEMVTTDLPEVPDYFRQDVALNRQGAPAVADGEAPSALTAEEAAAWLEKGALVLDVRSSAEYGAAHLPGSLNVALQGQFASWAGSLVPAGRALVIVASDLEGAREAALRLARVGLENVAGFLAGGVASWEAAGRPLARMPQIAVDELSSRRREDPDLLVLDVRRAGEYASGHVPGAVNVPLHRLEQDSGRLPRGRPLALICAGGYRSSAATSVLERGGFEGLFNVVGGTSAWIAAGYETEAADPA